MLEPDSRLRVALADRYAIERELGRGGMARVYLADDLKYHRNVAIKVLHPELAATLGPDRFLREIEIAAQLSHPHILPLLDSGEAGGFLYYVMPYVDGQSLRRRLAREGELPIAETVRILREVVDALAEAHAHGVIHRDIKPDNVLLRGQHAVVTDFGVAKAVSEGTGRQQLTTAGIAIGTPAYMAPEQAAANPQIDHRADIYAVGAMAYEMLAGRPPFDEPTPEAVLAAHVTQTPEPVSSRREVPGPLAEVVMRCLKKKPADRWQTAGELLAQLELLSPTETTPTATDPETAVAAARSQRRWLLAGSVALAVLVSAGLVFWYGTGRVASARTPPGLVVLPCENTGSPGNQHFAEGVSEDISHRLAALSGLRVIARGSANQYQGNATDLSRIGDDLGVEYIVQCSVQSGNAGQVRVRTRLTRVADQSLLWAQSYDTVLADILKVQSSIAEQVSNALEIRLAQRERQVLAAVPTTNQEAYDLFLQANLMASRLTISASEHDDWLAVINLYARAVTLDSNFALAFAKLSQAYSATLLHVASSTTERQNQARSAAERALYLNSQLPEAHLAMGDYFWANRDEQNALREYQLALLSAPGSGEALSLIGFVHLVRGRFEEASQSYRRALDTDPRNLAATTNLAWALLSTGQIAEARRVADRALALSPMAFGVKVYVELADGRNDDAREVIRQTVARLGPDHLVSGAVLWYVNVPLLDSVAQNRLVSDVIDTATRTYSFRLARAEVHRLRGNDVMARAYYESGAAFLERVLRSGADTRKTQLAFRGAALAMAYARLGRTADALREARKAAQLLPLAEDQWNGTDVALVVGDVYLLTGRRAQALDWLESAYSYRGMVAQFAWKLRSDLLYTPLRGDPRFERLAALRPGG